MKKIAAVILALIAFSIVQPTAAYAGGQIDGGDIANGSITGADIDNGTLTGVDVRNGSIGNVDLANYSVSSVKLGSGSVTSRAIASDQVGSDEIADASIKAGDIAPDAIDYLVNQVNLRRGSGSAGLITNGSPAESNNFQGLYGSYVSGDLLVVFNARYQSDSPVRVSIEHYGAGITTTDGVCIAVPFNGVAECQILATAGSQVGFHAVAASESGQPVNGDTTAVAIKVG